MPSDRRTTLNVRILTDLQLIDGSVSLISSRHERISDHLNSLTHRFLAVSDARVTTFPQETIETIPFLAVALEHIRSLVPLSEVQEGAVANVVSLRQRTAVPLATPSPVLVPTPASTPPALSVPPVAEHE
jgi:hypothetical protein